MMLGGWIGRCLYRAGRLTDDTLAAGELRLRIDGDGLQISDSNHVEIYSWHAFTEISEYADYIVLWLNRIRGVVVPARALAGEEARLEFVNFAREHIAPAAPCLARA
jgi:YcxB-like protein